MLLDLFLKVCAIFNIQNIFIVEFIELEMSGYRSMSADGTTEADISVQLGAMSITPICCRLCCEIVFDKSLAAPLLGMLDSCSCIICYSCLQTRILQNILHYFTEGFREPHELIARSIICPVCRNPSNMIISSDKFFTTPEDRLEYIIKYRESRQNIICPFEKHGIAFCYCNPSHN